MPPPPRARAATDVPWVDALFDRQDQDGDGSLGQEEIASVLQSMGLDSDPEHVRSLIARFDQDGSGRISTGEFRLVVNVLCVATSRVPAPKRIEETW
jgi:hypothetical protein